MQLDAISRNKVSKYVKERIDQVKNELVFQQDENNTSLLRGRYLELEQLQELLAKQDKPPQQ